MKTLSLFFLAGLTGLAPAAPYIAYSGDGDGSDFSASGNAKTATVLYVLTDLADTSSFAVLQVDPAGKTYTVNSRPSSSPTAEETNNNFLGGITTSNAKDGMAVLSFSNETTDASGNTFVAHAYATGALTLRDTTLVDPRRKPLVVKLKSNGTAMGTYTFSTLTPAVTTGDVPFAKSLSGVFFNYEIASDGSLAHARTQGTFALTENGLLTELANIGGGYASGKNSAALLPFSIPSGSTAADAYAAWLAAFAQVNGYTLAGGVNAADASAGTLSLGTSSEAGAVTLSGTIDINSGAVGIVKVGAGTLMLNNSGTAVGVITPTSVGNAFTGVLTLGGSLSVAGNTGGTTITQVDTTPGDSGATLTLNVSNTFSGGTTVNGGTLTLGSGTTGGTTTTLSGSSSNLLGNGATVTLVGGTITVSAVNNGLVDGTITLSTLTSGIAFTGATLIVNSVNTGATLNPGDTVTGNISLTAGTLVNTNGTLTDAGSTLTVTTPAP